MGDEEGPHEEPADAEGRQPAAGVIDAQRQGRAEQVDREGPGEEADPEPRAPDAAEDEI